MRLKKKVLNLHLIKFIENNVNQIVDAYYHLDYIDKCIFKEMFFEYIEFSSNNDISCKDFLPANVVLQLKRNSKDMNLKLKELVEKSKIFNAGRFLNMFNERDDEHPFYRAFASNDIEVRVFRNNQNKYYVKQEDAISCIDLKSNIAILKEFNANSNKLLSNFKTIL